MEQNNQNNEFEHFLKDSISDFIMIPQRKVWYGIYNHLHPEKKWPSIAVCFCILVSIMHLGISNNKNINNEIQQAKNKETSNQNLVATQLIKDNLIDINTYVKNNIKKIIEPISPIALHTSTYTAKQIPAATIDKSSFSSSFIDKNNTESTTKNKLNIKTENAIATQNELLVNNVESITKENIITPAIISSEISTSSKKDILESLATVAKAEDKNDIVEKKTETKQDNGISSFLSLIKLPKHKKKNDISYYITPSIGFRRLLQKDNTKNVAATNSTFAAITSNYGTADANLEDNKAFNFEIGGTIDHKISKKVKLKAGLQINYTNYISKATTLDHPTQSTVAARYASTQYKSVDFSAIPGDVNLNKTTLQISIPLGISYTIMGNEKVKWDVAGTLQPSLIIAGNGYVLSADKKYYLTEKDLLNRFNISAGVESFLSIKTANGIHLNVGPQLRYQLLSTYKKNYNFTENLFNVGMKIGISTPF